MTNKGEVKAGAKIATGKPGMEYLHIMAVVDNYVMLKYSRCMPFILTLKECTKLINALTGNELEVKM
jgi:hypothetical protein